MSTKSNFGRESYTGIAFAANKNLYHNGSAYSLKRSIRILIGGLTLGWIACLTIIISTVMQA